MSQIFKYKCLHTDFVSLGLKCSLLGWLDPGKSMSFAILENLISAFSDMEYTFELYCLKKIAEKTTQG